VTTDELIHRDAFNLFLGDLIGSGMSRKVFTCPLMPNCIVKVESGSGYFQNVIEWETWQRVKLTEFSRWFAECKAISPNGSILVMERTLPAAPSDYPERMPTFLTDFKRANYGVVPDGPTRSGKAGSYFLVCHDYGTNLLFENGMTNRTRKVTWSDDL